MSLVNGHGINPLALFKLGATASYIYGLCQIIVLLYVCKSGYVSNVDTFNNESLLSG